MKTYSQACDENKDPILHVLTKIFSGVRTVLEIGSGSGQHAAYFARHLPHLTWYASDVAEHHPSISAWLVEAGLANTRGPLPLNVTDATWPLDSVDAVFSANTAHIMSWPEVEAMIAGVGRVLVDQGVFALYGPFNYGGAYTSASNARFDAWLKARDPASGVRHFEDIDARTRQAGLRLLKDYTMPVNNRLLAWRKSELP